MKLSDLTVEVRDKNLNRIGLIRHEDLNLKATPLFNNVGAWTLKLPTEHHLVPTLKTPGAGIIVTGPTDVLFSGPVTTPTFESTPTDPVGTVTFEGITDDVILSDYLAFPQPSNPDPTTQTESHDVRTGDTESLLHAYVNANLGPGAPASRRKANLVMGTNGQRGPTIKKSARFPTLGNLLSDIAIVGQLGFRVVQRGSQLRFETYAINDRTATIRLDVNNGQLSGQKVSIQAPTATRVLVAGQNEGVERQFVQRTSTDSLAAETEWGRRIERFRDQRQTSDVAELQNAGDEVLDEEGFTSIAVQAVPAEDSLDMEFGRNWYLGDKVTVVVDGAEVKSTATGMTMIANSDGFRVGVVIGELSGATNSRSENRLTTIEDRVAHLEKNAESTSRVLLDQSYAPKDDTPIGAIIAYGGTSAPTGWHLCDGTAHGSTALQAVLGSANVPDLRDRFLVGAGSSYARGATGGANTVALTAAESGLRDHGHGASAPAHDVNHYHTGGTGDDSPDHAHAMTGWREPGHFGNTGARATFASLDAATGTYGMYHTGGATARHQHAFTTSWMSHNNSHGHSITVNGSGAANAASAHENRPPYYALTYIIKKV